MWKIFAPLFLFFCIIFTGGHIAEGDVFLSIWWGFLTIVWGWITAREFDLL